MEIMSSGERVLVIEDDPGVARILMRLFEREGRGVLVVERAEHVPAALETGPFAAAFIDIDLPDGGDGVRLGLELRARHPGMRVVMMSGEPGSLERAGAAGLDRRLQKPFTAEQLSAALS